MEDFERRSQLFSSIWLDLPLFTRAMSHFDDDCSVAQPILIWQTTATTFGACCRKMNQFLVNMKYKYR